LSQTVTNHRLYVIFCKIAIAESSLSQEIPNIFLTSLVCYSASARRFLAVYKFKVNVYGKWEKYCLKLLPTTVYTSICRKIAIAESSLIEEIPNIFLDPWSVILFLHPAFWQCINFE